MGWSAGGPRSYKPTLSLTTWTSFCDKSVSPLVPLAKVGNSVLGSGSELDTDSIGLVNPKLEPDWESGTGSDKVFLLTL